MKLYVALFAFLLTTHDGLAQSSTARVKADIRGQYQLMKRAVEQEIKTTFHSGRPRSSKTYDLTGCIGADPSIFSKDSISTSLAAIASEVRLASLGLTWAGYPRDFWKPLLEGFEAQMLADLARTRRWDGDKYVERAAAVSEKLLEYRNSANSKLPIMDWNVGCGGMYQEVRLVTEPRGGRVRMLPSLFYVFCSKQGVAAQNFSECDQWKTFNDGQEFAVSGAYRMEAIWNSGLSMPPDRIDFKGIVSKVWRVTHPGRQ